MCWPPVTDATADMDDALGRLRTRFDELQVFASARSRRRFLRHLLVAVVALIAGVALVQQHLAFLSDAAAARAFIGQYGVWSPVVLVVLQALQVVVAPVPGQILAVGAGYLFGPWWGTLYNMLGITIGSSLAFWLSRRFGRTYVERIVHEDTLATLDAVGDDYTRLALFLTFLVPGLPDDVLCFLGGLTKIPLWQLVGIAVVGRAPAFFLVNVIGDLVGTGRVGSAIGLTVALAGLSVAGYLYRDGVVDFFEKL